MSPHSDGRACPEMVDTIEHYEMGLVPATITMTNRTFRGRREQSCSNGNSNLARCTLTVTSILTAFIILLCGQSNQLGFQPRLITRFCYNSPNLSTINSQCVLCNYYVFDATLLGCTGSTALNVNITASQAFCVISQCLGQVRQSPVFLGRRRRRKRELTNDENHNGDDVDEKVNDDDDVDDDSMNNEWYPIGNWSDHFSVVKQVDADVYFEDE